MTTLVDTLGRPKAMGGNITNLRHDSIEPDPDQPRKTFDPQALKELAGSLDSEGLLQPISVRPHPESTTRNRRYIIIAGERRWRAAGLQAWETIPAIVRKDLMGDQAARLQLLENIVRQDLNPIEEAEAFKRMIDSGYSAQQLSKVIGKTTAYVLSIVNMLNAIPEAIHLVRTGALWPRAAYHISSLSPQDQRRVLKAVNTQGLNHTDLLGLCKRLEAEAQRAAPLDFGFAEEELAKAQKTFADSLAQVNRTLDRLAAMEQEQPGTIGEALDLGAIDQLDEVVTALQRVKRQARDQQVVRMVLLPGQ